MTQNKEPSNRLLILDINTLKTDTQKSILVRTEINSLWCVDVIATQYPQ